jgi:hypothetical protein
MPWRKCSVMSKTTAEIRTLIRRMAEENLDWGAPKIRGELCAPLGYRAHLQSGTADAVNRGHWFAEFHPLRFPFWLQTGEKARWQHIHPCYTSYQCSGAVSCN